MNENAVELKQFKGEVRPCEFCRREEVLMGRACPQCLGNFYLATCTNCNGTGKETSGAIWDGGKSQYTSTCNPCAGRGYFPARASEYVPVYERPVPMDDLPPCTIATIPGLIVRRTHSSGK